MVKVDGYKQMRSNFEQQQVTMLFDPAKTNPPALIRAINANSKYRASVWGTF
jgi:hypothetical protein